MTHAAMISFTAPQPHRLLSVRRLKKPARCVAYSPDGKGLAMGLKVPLLHASASQHDIQDGGIVVVDAVKFGELAKFQHRKEEISDIKFSPGAVCFGSCCADVEITSRSRASTWRWPRTTTSSTSTTC